MLKINWRWMSADGLDVTGTDEVDGYSVSSFFDRDLGIIRTLPPHAAYEALLDAYRGPDIAGVSLYWTIDGCGRGHGLDDDRGPSDDSPDPRPLAPARA